MLNDSKYGYDVKDSVMRVTLIKSGIDPNPVTDQEERRFVYPVFFHQGNWKEGGTHPMACMLNTPPDARTEEAHRGVLESVYSFASMDCGNIMIEAIKKAEDNNDIIMRLYEYQNKRTEAVLTLHGQFAEIYDCDLMEKSGKLAGKTAGPLNL